jgi:hypothetical protein
MHFLTIEIKKSDTLLFNDCDKLINLSRLNLNKR